jgi:hypothetical protein
VRRYPPPPPRPRDSEIRLRRETERDAQNDNAFAAPAPAFERVDALDRALASLTDDLYEAVRTRKDASVIGSIEAVLADAEELACALAEASAEMAEEDGALPTDWWACAEHLYAWAQGLLEQIDAALAGNARDGDAFRASIGTIALYSTLLVPGTMHRRLCEIMTQAKETRADGALSLLRSVQRRALCLHATLEAVAAGGA